MNTIFSGIVLFFMMALQGSFAQGLYGEFGFGYAAGIAPVEIDYNTTETHSNTDISYKDEVVKGSFGKGLNIGGRFGYQFVNNFGVDLGINYLVSGRITSKYDVLDYTTNGNNGYTSKSVYTARMTRLNPALVLMQQNAKISPYARLGLVLGVGNVTVDYSENDDNGDTWSYQFMVYGGVAVGMSGSIGIKYFLKDRLSFVASLDVISMSYSPQRGEITSDIQNGVDVYPYLSVRDKQVEYLKEVTSNTSTTPDDTKPYQDTKFYLPFSSVGLNVGIRWDL